MFRLVITTIMMVNSLFTVSFVLAETISITPSSQCSTNEPCLTLSKFANDSNRYLIPNITITLLPGNHSLNSELYIENILNFEMISFNASVSCTESGRFVLRFVNQVQIKDVTFNGCKANQVIVVDKLTFSNCHFNGQSVFEQCLKLVYVSSLYIVFSTVFGVGYISIFDSLSVHISSSTFEYNTALEEGVLSVWSSTNVTIADSVFFSNRASTYGGAIFATGCDSLLITNTLFKNNSAGYEGGAVNVYECNLAIDNCSFGSNEAYFHGGRRAGGAVFALYSNVTVKRTLFANNTAHMQGGAIYGGSSNISLYRSAFDNNSVEVNGGALCINSHIFTVTIVSIDNCTFSNNKENSNEYGTGGGAIYILSSGEDGTILTYANSKFVTNTANSDGGAVFIGNVLYYITNFTLINTTFISNTANGYGEAIYMYSTHMTSSGFLNFLNNQGGVGVVYASQSKLLISGSTTSNNCGSFLTIDSNVTFQGNNIFMHNRDQACPVQSEEGLQEGGAMTCFQSNVVFEGETTFESNEADSNGGAILAVETKLHLLGVLMISNNIALTSGGGIYAHQSELNFNGKCVLSNNTARNGDGGGIHAISSTTRLFKGSLTFDGNNAVRGGGMLLQSNAKLYTIKSIPECRYIECSRDRLMLKFIGNTASTLGGAIFVTDDTNSGTCASVPSSALSTATSECFFQTLAFYLKAITYSEKEYNNILNTYFVNNSATIAGDTLYGGLLDRCTVSPLAEVFKQFPNTSASGISNMLKTTDIHVEDISSDAVRICFCNGNQTDCSYQPDTVKVKKGERFALFVVAIDQVGKNIMTNVHSSFLLKGGTFKEGQLIQSTTENCTEIAFNVFSPHDSEQLLLYPEGPCKDIGVSERYVNVTLSPCVCPVGFQPSNSETDCVCVCDPALKPHVTNCSIEKESIIREGRFWITFINETSKNSTRKGYIVSDNCPYDYCHPPSSKVYINLNYHNGADAQCAFNRSGRLCGSCQKGFSLSLGSSRCKLCSHSGITLIILFAIAGIALVVFLLVCNLTVAVGTINGLIFYAHVVISNRAIFLPFQKPTFMTIFIAWLNLDFGFETCFFNGLDGYIKVWLQLAFPVYLIILVASVIVISEHSPRFSRLISNTNPVAALATLILLSYAKLLRIIISALSFTTLDYPQSDKPLNVWLYDANLPYLEGKHIPLFITALLILLVGVVYTFLLSFWQWLLLCPNKRTLWWFGLNSFMDVYHAPYKKKHRYWTGLLLFARIVLYAISALDHIIADVRVNLLCISCVVGSLLLLKEVTVERVYKKWSVNFLNSLFLFNLLIFTVATYHIRETNGNQVAVAYLSTSICFHHISLYPGVSHIPVHTCETRSNVEEI